VFGKSISICARDSLLSIKQVYNVLVNIDYRMDAEKYPSVEALKITQCFKFEIDHGLNGLKTDLHG